jgi:hypothetical protein
VPKSNEADELLASLLSSNINARLRDSLERVKAACDFLDSSGVAITPTAVGNYCSDRWKGPKAQSVRNAKDTLFAYLQLRRAHQVLPASTRKASREPLIQDETVRAYVALVKAERDEAVRHKDRIVAGLRSIPGLPIDDLIASGFKPIAAKPERGVSDEVRGALERLFLAESLASVGLELYRHRLRHIATKKVLLEKADVEALLALTRSDGASSTSTPLLQHAEGDE